MPKKLRTIDDVAGKPGGFERFLKFKREVCLENEQHRSMRIKGFNVPESRFKLSDNERLALLS